MPDDGDIACVTRDERDRPHIAAGHFKNDIQSSDRHVANTRLTEPVGGYSNNNNIIMRQRFFTSTLSQNGRRVKRRSCRVGFETSALADEKIDRTLFVRDNVSKTIVVNATNGYTPTARACTHGMIIV